MAAAGNLLASAAQLVYIRPLKLSDWSSRAKALRKRPTNLTSLLFAAFAILVVQRDIIVVVLTDRFGYDELSNPRTEVRGIT